MLSRNQIEQILSAELEIAKQRNILAADNFREVINDDPAGMPAADGTFRIQTAGRDHRTALEGLHKALKRFNDYIVRGTIPDDLKNR